MKQYYSFLLFLIFVISANISSAQEIKVQSFQKLEKDLLARIQPRLDLNENPCSIVRIVSSDAKDLIFEGNIVGEPVYFAGEVVVYMPNGSKRLIMRSDKYGVLRYDFPQKIEYQVVYEARLKLIRAKDDRWKGLVMPILGYDFQRMSYGIMFGVVKRTGGYIKAKTNFNSFKFPTNSYPITLTLNEGIATDVSTKNEVWLSGEEKHGDFSITGGVLQQIWKPLYLYAGAGYGVHERILQTIEGHWAECQDNTYRGVEAEIGALFQVKGAAISLGIQTNSFKYSAMNVGIGYLF